MTNVRHWIVTGKGTGNIYAKGATDDDAITRARSLLGPIDAHRAGQLSAREIPNPRPDTDPDRKD